jgi:hypothetical protein
VTNTECKAAAQIVPERGICEIEPGPVPALRHRGHKPTDMYALILESEPIAEGFERIHLPIDPIGISISTEIVELNGAIACEPVVSQKVVSAVADHHRLKTGHLQGLPYKGLRRCVGKSDISDNQRGL